MEVYHGIVLKWSFSLAFGIPVLINSSTLFGFSPVHDKALVPYIPRNPFEDPAMRGRISEISLEEADRITCQAGMLKICNFFFL